MNTFSWFFRNLLKTPMTPWHGMHYSNSLKFFSPSAIRTLGFSPAWASLWCKHKGGKELVWSCGLWGKALPCLCCRAMQRHCHRKGFHFQYVVQFWIFSFTIFSLWISDVVFPVKSSLHTLFKASIPGASRPLFQFWFILMGSSQSSAMQFKMMKQLFPHPKWEMANGHTLRLYGIWGEAAIWRGLYPPPTFHMESMWNPYHSRWIPPIPYGICFGWDPSHFGDSIPPGIHIIPCGFHAYSMEWPFGIHLELWYRFHNHSTWIPYGFHPIWESTWIPHGL